MPGFPRVLETIADIYRNRRGDVTTSADRIVEHIQSRTFMRQSSDPLTRDILDSAYRALAPEFDRELGGFGSAPKFPQAMVYEFLLRYWKTASSEQALAMADATLDQMERGGMYDQIGGGFHRYSTDRYWLVPHFEKMLYDNALLAPLYLHGWLVTRKERYREVAGEILEYVRREMTDGDGGFYSATDADSEGEEGKFFVWQPEEIDAVVGAEAGRVVRAYYGVTDEGNFEGTNILHVPRAEAEVAAELGISVDELRRTIAEARPKLYEAREKRVPPGLDDKVLVSWNGMMMRAFAECGAVLDNAEWIDAARRNADFLLRELVADGRLLRTWRREASGSGRAGKVKGYLEDYALLADGLIALYEATFEQRWLSEATRLADGMVELFWDESAGVFYDTGRDHESLVVRPRDIFDNAMPCGGSSAALMLLRLAAHTGNEDYRRYATTSLRSMRDLMAQAPSGFANWLAALDLYLGPSREVVLIGPADDPEMRAMRAAVFGRYEPNRIVAGAESAVDPAPTPLLEGRGPIDGRPAAYVCENYVCAMPVTGAAALDAQLAGTSAAAG
jgi:uncharacterized protein YyaL (SSP411 family)